jgi:glycosyltransferase involved in cell wall biosynthesis
VVIPCLNEAATIERLVDAVREHLPTIVVVDDGSSDETARLANSAGAIVLQHERPCGKGASLKAGLNWLAQRQFSWAVTMDGDGQHVPEDLPKLLTQAERGRASMVVGNRLQAAQDMPWLRRAVNRWMSKRLSKLTGHWLPDSQCGYRLLQLSLWSKLYWETAHFEVESELLTGFLGTGARVEFVPIQVIYRSERTKIRPLLDAWRWCRWYWKAASCNKTRLAPLAKAAMGRSVS